jgi:site-specific DNA recombinase
MNETRLCGLYGRVSTDRQAAIRDGGLDAQFGLMEQYVAFEQSKSDKARWVVVDRYREEGWSGKNLERPEFKRLMRDIETGRVNTVIVHKIDRVTRSLRDFYDLWEKFEEYGVQFISLHEKFDTTSAVGRAMLKLILVFAELEREQVAERTQVTMAHRARQGLWNGGSRPLGYDLDPARKGTLIPNAEEARVVLEHVFKKYLDLGSVGKLIRYLAALGIRKPVYQSRRSKQKGGGNYTKPELLRLLTNPVYIGKIRYEDEVFDGQHEGIVPVELFDEVQALLERNRERNGNSLDEGTHVFVLQGLIRCGKCGSYMTPKWSTGRGGKRHHYYECTKEAHSAGTACDAKYVPAEAAEEYVLAELRKWTMTEEEIVRVVRDTNEHKDDALVNLGAEEKALRERLREVQSKVDALVNAIESGGELRSLRTRLEGLEAEQRSMEEELARVEREADHIRQHALSTEIMVGTYRDFPAILDRLLEARRWQEVKELLACHVEVIDWHQDAADPSSGTVEIMLYEQTCEDGPSAQNETRDARVVNAGCVTGNERLPE